MTTGMSRREWLAAAPAALGASALAGRAAAAQEPRRGRPAGEPFGYCLNTSTLRGHDLTIAEEVAIAAEAGYGAIEPWVSELEKHAESGSLKDLGKRIADRGLEVPSAIGFFAWGVDDESERRKGLDAAKKAMDLVREVGGTRLAAPPVGLTDRAEHDLDKLAERYLAVLSLGDETGVVPELEVWGFSKTLHRLGQAVYVAVESGHPSACILADVYHLHRGGSDFHGLHLLGPGAMHVLHVNDYPDRPLADLSDADRVYPGDGVAPLPQILRDLDASGYRGFLSLELFNKDYAARDARTVARTGLDKTRAQVRNALG